MVRCLLLLAVTVATAMLIDDQPSPTDNINDVLCVHDNDCPPNKRCAKLCSWSHPNGWFVGCKIQCTLRSTNSFDTPPPSAIFRVAQQRTGPPADRPSLPSPVEPTPIDAMIIPGGPSMPSIAPPDQPFFSHFPLSPDSTTERNQPETVVQPPPLPRSRSRIDGDSNLVEDEENDDKEEKTPSTDQPPPVHEPLPPPGPPAPPPPPPPDQTPNVPTADFDESFPWTTERPIFDGGNRLLPKNAAADVIAIADTNNPYESAAGGAVESSVDEIASSSDVDHRKPQSDTELAPDETTNVVAREAFNFNRKKAPIIERMIKPVLINGKINAIPVSIDNDEQTPIEGSADNINANDDDDEGKKKPSTTTSVKCPSPIICSKNCGVFIDEFGCQGCQCLWKATECKTDTDCASLNEQYCELPAKTCACREGFIKSRTKSGVCEKSIGVLSPTAKKERVDINNRIELAVLRGRRRQMSATKQQTTSSPIPLHNHHYLQRRQVVHRRSIREVTLDDWKLMDERPRRAERLQWPGPCDSDQHCPPNLYCINGDCWHVPDKPLRSQQLIAPSTALIDDEKITHRIAATTTIANIVDNELITDQITTTTATSTIADIVENDLAINRNIIDSSTGTITTINNITTIEPIMTNSTSTIDDSTTTDSVSQLSSSSSPTDESIATTTAEINIWSLRLATTLPTTTIDTEIPSEVVDERRRLQQLTKDTDGNFWQTITTTTNNYQQPSTSSSSSDWRPVRVAMLMAKHYVRDECRSTADCGRRYICCRKYWCDESRQCGTARFCLPDCLMTKVTYLWSSGIGGQPQIDIVYD